MLKNNKAQTKKKKRSIALLDLKDFIVEIILKSLAVFWVLPLLLELLFSFWTGAASCPLALLLCLVPLLFLITVHLSGHPWRQLHPCWRGARHDNQSGGKKEWDDGCGKRRYATQSYVVHTHTHTHTHTHPRGLSVIVNPKPSNPLMKINHHWQNLYTHSDLPGCVDIMGVQKRKLWYCANTDGHWQPDTSAHQVCPKWSNQSKWMTFTWTWARPGGCCQPFPTNFLSWTPLIQSWWLDASWISWIHILRSLFCPNQVHTLARWDWVSFFSLSIWQKAQMHAQWVTEM